MNQGRFDEIKEDIFKETGFLLIGLEAFREDLMTGFGALAVTQNEGLEKIYLIFWRPQFRIYRFYYHYRGEEILKLQERLFNIGILKERPNGIVEIETINAVNLFQKKAGLPETGSPGDRTIFLLFHYEKQVDSQ